MNLMYNINIIKVKELTLKVLNKLNFWRLINMKKSELALGNVVKAYKGEKEFQITQINEETVILNGEKEVKTSTLLKNYKFVRSEELVEEVEETQVNAVENETEIELPTFQLKLIAPMVAGLLPSGKVEKAEKVKEIIYGIKVSKGINQTLIWKVLKKVCELKNEEGTKIAKELKEKYPEAFSGAVRCLVSKKRINYINSIC